jgi:hypothetical protein
VPSLLWGIHPVSLSIRKRKYKGENPREGPPHVEAELNVQRLTTPTDQVNGVGTEFYTWQIRLALEGYRCLFTLEAHRVLIWPSAQQRSTP